MNTDSDKFSRAREKFDQENARDPNGKELLYSQRMTLWLERLAPDSSEPLKLAARSQHIRRWEIPRNRFPMNRAGYLNWRKTLYQFHADVAGQILRETGYDDATIQRVQSLLKKEKIKSDPDMQTLEDVICLVFLENYFDDFARDKDEAKLLNIIKRTWAKMSPHGREAAMGLNLSARDKELIVKAISGSQSAGPDE